MVVRRRDGFFGVLLMEGERRREKGYGGAGDMGLCGTRVGRALERRRAIALLAVFGVGGVIKTLAPALDQRHIHPPLATSSNQ